MAERRTEALGVVVTAPGRDLFAGMTERAEPVQVQALATKLPVQALDEGVPDGLARLDEAQPNAGAPGSVEHRPARALRPVVEDDLLGQAELPPVLAGHPA